MNFICEKCKQKYHVADEKLQGRAVTRFRGKKCDHIIELEVPNRGRVRWTTPCDTPNASLQAALALLFKVVGLPR